MQFELGTVERASGALGEKLHADLIAYCSRDTDAMLELFKILR